MKNADGLWGEFMKKTFDNGVSYYVSGTTHVNIHFPEGDIVCKWCPFCRCESELGRYWCRLTNDMLYSVNTHIGDNCPIKFGDD